MPKIVYVQPDGRQDTLDVAEGSSVMQAAAAAGIAGIVAECGGNAMCATCHVYTDTDDQNRLPEISVDEDEMLDCTAASRQDGSRLSCQLVVTGQLDGLVVRVPRGQT
ncbi:2Fe-2S iron-sulfur cluster-binding protein [Haloechinothrix halophila]|uniref:2Fe-2S iron-sulfur cluster-binding protein n=1 Tax=Haloechinothrix halophila TaxID=1069073 RepID=UPI0004005398|nr:2Fe-2S iron-sulfur cluster-binding protein [Haloechinothrix halophila]